MNKNYFSFALGLSIYFDTKNLNIWGYVITDEKCPIVMTLHLNLRTKTLTLLDNSRVVSSLLKTLHCALQGVQDVGKFYAYWSEKRTQLPFP